VSLYKPEDFECTEHTQIYDADCVWCHGVEEEMAKRANAKRDAEIERLRLALGESEAIRRVLEESELTKRYRELVAEKDCYLRERNQAETEIARLRAESLEYATLWQIAKDDNARLREALEFYAENLRHSQNGTALSEVAGKDGGDVARAALKGKCSHEWGIDGTHSNEFCKKCFVNRPEGKS
jgi:hypothetical protein